MGVSIHYRGRVTDIQKVKTICDELVAIAEKMNWRYIRLDEDWSQPSDASIEATDQGSQVTGHLPLKGVALIPPPKCEALQFFFDSNGILREPISMSNTGNDSIKSEDAWISVKTQYAGPDAHILVVGLLKYIKTHHIPDLAVQDEGGYWETENVEILKEKMDFVGEKITAVNSQLSRVTKGHIESYSADELASMIEALLYNKFDVENSTD